MKNDQSFYFLPQNYHSLSNLVNSTTVNCGDGTFCVNNNGGYTCACSDGYEQLSVDQDGLAMCFDADECADNSHDCIPQADCNNTNGSFFCTCKGIC